MRRISMYLTLALVGLMLPGCSQFQARGPTALQLEVRACDANGLIAQVDKGTLSNDTALVLLAENGVIMKEWNLTATMNWFDYAFGDKEIWVDSFYYDKLAQAAALFAEAERRVTTQPARGPYYVKREFIDFKKFKAARDGVSSPK